MIGLVRKALDRAGYELLKRDFMRFGYDPLLDVSKLARGWGLPVKTIFDVGANAGQFRSEAESAFPECEVHSFEPHPATYRRLCEGAGSRARSYQLALSDKPGRVPFYEYGDKGDGSMMNSLTPDAGFALQGGWKPKVIEVEATTLDTLCQRERIARIDLLKVDVEGMDLAVLKGAKRMLREGRIGFVYAEFNDLLDRPGVTGGSLLPMARFLVPLGLRYVATYTDRVDYLEDRPLWVSANVLFAKPPGL